MYHAGDFAASAIVYIPFDSFAASTGAPAAVTNFVAGDIQVYKNGGTTQRSSANGITVSTSFDTQTGLQMIAIDTSDNTDAGFYAAGGEYQVAVADITVDGQTLRFWAATFAIERTNGALARAKDLQARTPAALGANGNIKADVRDWIGSAVSTPTNAGVPNVNAKTWNDLTTVALPLVPTTAGRTLDVSAGGEGGVDWANVGSPTTALDLSGTTIKTTQKVDVETIKTRAVSAAGAVTVGAFVGQDTAAIGVNASGHVSRVVLVDTLTTYTGNTVQTGDNYARIGAPAGASIAADIAAVKTVVDAVSGYVDTEVAAILAAVDTEVAAIKAKTDNLPDGIFKNTALANFPFFMVLTADHVSGATGLAVTAERSIDGGAFAACTNAVSEISAGFYKINLSAADLNGDTIALKFTAATADTTGLTIKTDS